MKGAGIQLTSAGGPSSVVFGPSVFEAGNFHMFMYAWVANGDPSGWNSIYNCGGDSNFKGYCSMKVTDLLNENFFDPALVRAVSQLSDGTPLSVLEILRIHR